MISQKPSLLSGIRTGAKRPNAPSPRGRGSSPSCSRSAAPRCAARWRDYWPRSIHPAASPSETGHRLAQDRGFPHDLPKQALADMSARISSKSKRSGMDYSRPMKACLPGLKVAPRSRFSRPPPSFTRSCFPNRSATATLTGSILPTMPWNGNGTASACSFAPPATPAGFIPAPATIFPAPFQVIVSAANFVGVIDGELLVGGTARSNQPTTHLFGPACSG